ncbi:hypothetical protein HMPREF1986_00288 [Oribacterium sp. oral taxon 078 str. F0263]|uniref:alpha/beta hydrolase n=1 Tax=Oribacterium sp. oral taxon 078 TaxID=652706 RepID=UPI0003ADE85E|nr:alpha/beta hydrolase [Oribacterium sp. oral taxon 078]ERL22677.1 hypothetical protein HMPREF1986_00288 [Oribacterium sp. oral taxon 078 str. F0263]
MRREGESVLLYIHGKGGSAEEAGHYRKLFPFCDIVGLDYKSFTPWGVGKEIRERVHSLKGKCKNIFLIANSIGAFYSMNAGIERDIIHAWFISPIIDMERLITDRMKQVNLSESELREKGVIKTDLGDELSWEYLCYIRKNPIEWKVPTDILYGSEDGLTPLDAITAFSKNDRRSLTVMKGGEHWFHSKEQMQFLDEWIQRTSKTLRT